MSYSKFLFTLVAFSPLAGTALADPCRDNTKVLAFADATIKLSAYEDCNNPNIAYVVPQELTIDTGRFSGKKSFLFRELPSGEAQVFMRLNLLVDRARMTRAVVDLRRNLLRPLQFKPFEVRNLDLQGFGAVDGVVSQRIVATANDSNAYFTIALKLDAAGVALWKQAAQEDFYTFQPASLKFEMKFADASGGENWIKEEREVFLAGLPSCEILNSCKDTDRDARLLSAGNAFGRYYLQTQYLRCSDLLDKTLVPPGQGEIEDSSLDEAEKQVAYLATVDGFNAEQANLTATCAVENDTTRGRRWLATFLQDQNVGCETISQWNFSRIEPFTSAASDAFKSGARLERESYAAKCRQTAAPAPSCDERQGSACGGVLTANTSMCVSGQDILKIGPSETSSCRLHVYEDFGLGLVARVHGVATPAIFAKLNGICATFPGSSSQRAAYKIAIICN